MERAWSSSLFLALRYARGFLQLGRRRCDSCAGSAGCRVGLGPFALRELAESLFQLGGFPPGSGVKSRYSVSFTKHFVVARALSHLSSVVSNTFHPLPLFAGGCSVSDRGLAIAGRGRDQRDHPPRHGQPLRPSGVPRARRPFGGEARPPSERGAHGSAPPGVPRRIQGDGNRRGHRKGEPQGAPSGLSPALRHKNHPPVSHTPRSPAFPLRTAPPEQRSSSQMPIPAQ